MTTEHTPGPWVFNESTPMVISAPKEGFITRHVCRLDASTMAAVNQKANARLIASAPELLEALQELLAVDESAGVDVPTIMSNEEFSKFLKKCSEKVDFAREKAKKAIAKATGGQL